MLLLQERHFSDVHKKLQQHKTFKEDSKCQEEILSNISEKIEKKFGRKKPFICEYSKYEKNKTEIHHQLALTGHFTQDTWPESTKVLLEALDANDGLENISSDDSFDSQRFHTAKKSRYILSLL